MLRTVRILLLIAVASAIAAPSAAAAKDVHLRGTAYEFNRTNVLLDGARIRVAEFPRLEVRTKPDGTYDLAVPDRSRVTPYITMPGYHTSYLQTFTTDGEDLERVNFQTPTEDVYRALAGLLQVPLTETGDLRDCAIVSTFSTRNVRDLTFAEFTAYGAHGVAGASAFATPALPPPVYFNENVVPDRAQQLSSKDGGVVFTEVPAGRYTIRARPSGRFASFVATCRPGRVVISNPPWGLHELGLRMPADVSAGWLRKSGQIRLRKMRVTKLPSKSVVTAQCSGAGCPFRSRKLKTKGSSLDVVKALGSAAGRIHSGQTFDLTITAHAHDGKLVRWRLRGARTPKAQTMCIPLGNTKPRDHC